MQEPDSFFTKSQKSKQDHTSLSKFNLNIDPDHSSYSNADTKNKDKDYSEETKILYLSTADPRILEYDCSAAQAMEILGIKRSRLHQITGSKLACARIKIGRYLRPMYKKSDLTDYLHSLRSPLSKAKSQKIFDDSLNSLKNFIHEIKNLKDEKYFNNKAINKNYLSQDLHNTLQNLTTLIKKCLNNLEKKSLHAHHHRISQISKIISVQSGIYYDLQKILYSIETKLEFIANNKSLKTYHLQDLKNQKITIETSQNSILNELTNQKNCIIYLNNVCQNILMNLEYFIKSYQSSSHNHHFQTKKSTIFAASNTSNNFSYDQSYQKTHKSTKSYVKSKYLFFDYFEKSSNKTTNHHNFYEKNYNINHKNPDTNNFIKYQYKSDTHEKSNKLLKF